MGERFEGSPAGNQEWKPGKATALDDALAQRELTAEEIAERRGMRPEMRLRADVPAIEVGMVTRAREVVERLQGDDLSTLALRTPNGEVAAMVVPVERYLNLASLELKAGPKEGRFDARIMPSDAALEAAGVEQVDPNATWA